MPRRTDKQLRGQLGEDAVCNELIKRNHTILQRNFRKSFGEIDIISQVDDYIVFTEVKTRHINSMISGLEAVDAAKCRKIIATADYYLCNVLEAAGDKQLQPRYDIAEVTITRDEQPVVVRVDIFENAFAADDSFTLY